MKKAIIILPVFILVAYACMPPAAWKDSGFFKAVDYYADGDSLKKEVLLPVETKTAILLFDNKVSYANRRAFITINVTEGMMTNVKEIELELTSYNDDAKYKRAVWFEIDSVGGYIGAKKIGNSKYGGDYILNARQKKDYNTKLSECIIASPDKGNVVINYTEMLKKPGTHQITCWVNANKNTKESKSWVTAKLVFR